ncbi:hypothetical protein K438DRAFT_2010072 [Mycena galopus ATCC 62051]|nr:hypothetical protein K438DRAFT_2010072 [Mycena galopus ATCC 62051]
MVISLSSMYKHRIQLARRSKNRLGLVQLPMEIQFLIIDQFEAYVAQLHKFCLVSRTWAAYTQSLLFRNVFVGYRSQERFLSILQARNDVGRHIINLTVVEGGNRWLRRDDDWTGRFQCNDHWSVFDSIAPILGEKMPNLGALDISHRYFRLDGQPAVGWMSITRLRMHLCRIATTDIMIAFIASFPRLESLDVSLCQVGANPSWSRKVYPMPVRHLKYLALGQFTQDPLIDWILAEPAEVTIDHFHILYLGPDASSLNSLLGKIGGGLRHLEISGISRLEQGREVALSIRPCTALATLKFCENGAYHPGPGITHVLSQITSPHLTTISFNIPLKMGYLNMPWEEVDHLLATEAFRHLKAVVFNMWGGQVLTPHEDVVPAMKARLLVLTTRGLLQFIDIDDYAERISLAEPPGPAPLTFRKRLSRRVANWVGRGAHSY